jgi:hypothetical protein
MLTSGANQRMSWDFDEIVDMTPEEANVWADGVRGELVRPTAPPIETPERNVQQRRGGYTTPETRRRT